MTDPVDVQRVLVTGTRTVSDDVTVVINGVTYGGWNEVRITRGVERCPMDFELKLTDFFTGDSAHLQIRPGDPCVVRIGKDPVITGYVDIVSPQLTKSSHNIVVLGRSKCADLVDCAAEWPQGQIVGSTVLEIAQKLAQPYGITVDTLDDPGGAIPTFNLVHGETPYEIIERLCRFYQLLAYDDVDGNLLLGRVSKIRAASGFAEGVNVESAIVTLSQHQRFSEYRCYLQQMDVLDDIGGNPNLYFTTNDAGVQRHRVHELIAEVAGGGVQGLGFAQLRTEWEAARRFGRSGIVHLTTDSWHDAKGLLYEPNTLVELTLPTLKVTGKVWAISEVTYRKGEAGTHCDLVIMPPEGFEPQPTLLQPVPAEFNAVPNNIAQP
jgi:prophage tail gpP-like protein